MTPKLKIYKPNGRNNWMGRIYIPKKFSSNGTKQEIYLSSQTNDRKEADDILNNWMIDKLYEIKNGKFIGNIPLLSIINKFKDYLLR